MNVASDSNFLKSFSSIQKLCITKIDGTTIDDAEDLGLVISMYNLIVPVNHFIRTGSISLHSKDEATNFDAEITYINAFKSFRYNAKQLKNTVADADNCF